MLIKTEQTNGSVVVNNINIDAYKKMFVENETIFFGHPDITTLIHFKTGELANEALDRIFLAYGMSAPFNKILDLTMSDEDFTELVAPEPEVEEVVVEENTNANSQGYPM
jgi:hypothetical protein